MEQFSLAGKRALVTGGSRGIGAEIVRLFHAQGALVALCHFNDDQAAAEICGAKINVGKLIAKHCDVADEQSVQEMADWVRAELGGLDVLVNCAGIGGDMPFAELSLKDWDRMIAVHLRGTFLVTRQFYSEMVERRYGRIINISSQLAYKGGEGLVHYTAAKAGVVGFTRSLALEAAPFGVTVNSIAPGAVETDLFYGMTEELQSRRRQELPIRRIGHVRDVAPTALLLASDAGAFYVGQSLSPNGGDVMI